MYLEIYFHVEFRKYINTEFYKKMAESLIIVL